MNPPPHGMPAPAGHAYAYAHAHALALVHAPSLPVAIPRQQVSIERLPLRRQDTGPRESMNCKSCRKRKIKCNRTHPTCEACHIFQCPCVYDAVPKKRGPKTDVLEALLKRVDGLEAKLKDKNAEGPSSAAVSVSHDADPVDPDASKAEATEPPRKRVVAAPSAATALAETEPDASASNPRSSSSAPRDAPPASLVQTGALLDAFFARVHGRPFYILDEPAVRRYMPLGQLPDHLCYAIWAVAARHARHPQGHQAAVRLGEEYATQARRSVNTDEPSIDALQTLLLLVIAFVASGKGKKAHMLTSNAVGMATALELHREVDVQAARVTPLHRELRRRLFWTCYMLDRFLACGSKRPSLLRDKSIALRLPAWTLMPTSPTIDGEFFQRGSSTQYLQGADKKSQGSTGMLIDITRVLGITNRYLAAGGVKGDSHFPWHSLSTLSKIRQELGAWASGTGDVFCSMPALFQHAEATILVLSKLVYHLIHCLVYRPFLPIDLVELDGNGQYQSWQIEATNMCFVHANAISELVEFARQAGTIEWPALVGYCICTAATVHIHGAHYRNPSATGETSLFGPAADFLSREMQTLRDLQHAWADVQHRRGTLQGIYDAHGELVGAMLGSAMRYTPGFHLEDFFDRYLNIGGPGGKSFRFDPAHLSLTDDVADLAIVSHTGLGATGPQSGGSGLDRPGLKRKATDLCQPLSGSWQQAPAAGAPTAPSPSPYQGGGLHPPETGLPPPHVSYDIDYTSGPAPRGIPDSAPVQAYGTPPLVPGAVGHGMTLLAGTGTSSRGYGGAGPTSAGTGRGTAHDGSACFDSPFGGLPANAFGSPSAAWSGEENQLNLLNSGAPAPSPGTKSASGSASTGTAQTEDKDPFLTLLEQLAEDEQRFNAAGNELDLLLAGSRGVQ